MATIAIRPGKLLLLVVAGCAHRPAPSPPTPPPPARVEVGVANKAPPVAPKTERDDALELDEQCLPKRVKLAVRIERNAIKFLRPICVVTRGERRCRSQPDVESKRLPTTERAQAGIAVLALTWDLSSGEPRLAARVERLDAAASLEEGRSLPRAHAIVTDCCSPLNVDGGIEGKVVRTSDSAPWIFEPQDPICTSEHIAGDAGFVRRAELRGAARDAVKRSPSNVRVTGTLMGEAIEVTRIRYVCPSQEVPGWTLGSGVDLTGTGTCAQRVTKVTTSPAPHFHTTVVDHFLLPRSGRWFDVGSFKTYEGPLDPEGPSVGDHLTVQVNDEEVPPRIEYTRRCDTGECLVAVYRFDGTMFVRVAPK